MNGVLLINKPSGITSHGVISRLRKKLGIKKMGHAGTLDPSATGLLIVCIGYATKISAYLTNSDKIYQTKLCLGKTTTTYDSEGEITGTQNPESITEKDLVNMIPRLCGSLDQQPPMYSAIKIQGKKLYQYARKNETIEVPTRKVFVESIRLLSFFNPYALLEIACSKGTYVRSLVHDLGGLLGVGAYVESIYRVQSGLFSVNDAVLLSEVLEWDMEKISDHIIPIRKVLQEHFHPIHLSKDEEDRIVHGVEYSKQNMATQDFSPDTMVLFLSEENQNEIAIGRWGEKGSIEIKRVF